jgi:hypothetical protein
MILVMLAYAFLVLIVLQEQQEHPISQESAPCEPMIALTCSEARHLLARLILPAPCSVSLVCQWSQFRRIHQYWAGYYHRRRRQKMLCG